MNELVVLAIQSELENADDVDQCARALGFEAKMLSGKKRNPISDNFYPPDAVFTRGAVTWAFWQSRWIKDTRLILCKIVDNIESKRYVKYLGE